MQHVALIVAGSIGICTAIIHGILTQRLMVRPIGRALVDQPRVSASIRRIIAPLLHYSTYSWVVCGLGLIAAARVTDLSARAAIAVLVAAHYAAAALGNLWATRGRHPGWILMATAVALILFDLLA